MKKEPELERESTSFKSIIKAITNKGHRFLLEYQHLMGEPKEDTTRPAWLQTFLSEFDEVFQEP